MRNAPLVRSPTFSWPHLKAISGSDAHKGSEAHTPVSCVGSSCVSVQPLFPQVLRAPDLCNLITPPFLCVQLASRLNVVLTLQLFWGRNNSGRTRREAHLSLVSQAVHQQSALQRRAGERRSTRHGSCRSSPRPERLNIMNTGACPPPPDCACPVTHPSSQPLQTHSSRALPGIRLPHASDILPLSFCLLHLLTGAPRPKSSLPSLCITTRGTLCGRLSLACTHVDESAVSYELNHNL